MNTLSFNPNLTTGNTMSAGNLDIHIPRISSKTTADYVAYVLSELGVGIVDYVDIVITKDPQTRSKLFHSAFVRLTVWGPNTSITSYFNTHKNYKLYLGQYSQEPAEIFWLLLPNINPLPRTKVNIHQLAASTEKLFDNTEQLTAIIGTQNQEMTALKLRVDMLEDMVKALSAPDKKYNRQSDVPLKRESFKEEKVIPITRQETIKMKVDDDNATQSWFNDKNGNPAILIPFTAEEEANYMDTVRCLDPIVRPVLGGGLVRAKTISEADVDKNDPLILIPFTPEEEANYMDTVRCLDPIVRPVLGGGLVRAKTISEADVPYKPIEPEINIETMVHTDENLFALAQKMDAADRLAVSTNAYPSLLQNRARGGFEAFVKRLRASEKALAEGATYHQLLAMEFGERVLMQPSDFKSELDAQKKPTFTPLPRFETSMPYDGKKLLPRFETSMPYDGKKPTFTPLPRFETSMPYDDDEEQLPPPPPRLTRMTSSYVSASAPLKREVTIVAHDNLPHLG